MLLVLVLCLCWGGFVRSPPQVWDEIDKDHNSKLELSELKAVLTMLGTKEEDHTDAALLALVKEMDRDGNGFISKEEFIIWCVVSIQHSPSFFSFYSFSSSSYSPYSSPAGRPAAPPTVLTRQKQLSPVPPPPFNPLFPTDL